MFLCPNCQQVVGEYPDQGVLAVVCAHCTFKYEISGGRVRGFTSRQVQLRAATEGRRANYGRIFELSIATSPRETLRFTFQTDRDDQWIRIAPDDRAVVVYSMRGNRREELLFVVNRTSAERFILGKPGDRSKYRAVIMGCVAAIATGAGAVWMSAPIGIILGVAAVCGFATTKGLAIALRPRHALRSDERVTLGARQELLAEKRSLLQLRGGVMAEIESRRALRRRLVDLRSRMAAVQLDAYAARMELIDSALKTLDAQLEIDMQLVAEYDRTLQIIDIEYDSSIAADSISVDGGSIMQARLVELRSAEERRAETTRQLAANAEVELLLRRHEG